MIEFGRYDKIHQYDKQKKGFKAVSLREFAKHKRANSWLSKSKFAFKFTGCRARLTPYFDIKFSPQNSVQRLLHQLF